VLTLHESSDPAKRAAANATNIRRRIKLARYGLVGLSLALVVRDCPAAPALEPLPPNAPQQLAADLAERGPAPDTRVTHPWPLAWQYMCYLCTCHVPTVFSNVVVLPLCLDILAKSCSFPGVRSLADCLLFDQIYQ
jgi:hypothetical protein